ncbi:MAG: hypothetical protein ACRC3H_05360 [Lachnospiraceae bacterium]
MKKIKDNIPIIIGTGILVRFLLDEPWNLLIGGGLIMPCMVYLVWVAIENRNKSSR